MPRSFIYTGAATHNDLLPREGYPHKRIHHEGKAYVHGDVHTNTIEGLWGLPKNCIRGGHHAVGAAYLQSYVDEYVFRYNHRGDAQPTMSAIRGRVSKTRHGRHGIYAPVGE